METETGCCSLNANCSVCPVVHEVSAGVVTADFPPVWWCVSWICNWIVAVWCTHRLATVCTAFSLYRQTKLQSMFGDSHALVPFAVMPGSQSCCLSLQRVCNISYSVSREFLLWNGQCQLSGLTFRYRRALGVAFFLLSFFFKGRAIHFIMHRKKQPLQCSVHVKNVALSALIRCHDLATTHVRTRM